MARLLALALLMAFAFPIVGCSNDAGNRPEDSMESMLKEAKKNSPGDEIKSRDSGAKKAEKGDKPEGAPQGTTGGPG